MQSDLGVPLPTCGYPVPIEDARSDLQEQLRHAWGPASLLLFTETFANDLLDDL